MEIYLIDYLGVHCGMHYYLDAFKKILSNDIPNANVRILSNYTDDMEKSFFLHQYKGSKLQKIVSLIRNYWRLYRFVVKHKNAICIYLTYGNWLDIPFLWIITHAKRHIIDIHEAIAQDLDDNSHLKRFFKGIYSSRVKCAIVHSERTKQFLDKFGYTGCRLFVPHFRYAFSKNYKIENVGQDIIKSVAVDKINILFFGNINYNKGVDILIDSVNQLGQQLADKINVIIAGKDFDGTCYAVKPKQMTHVNFILRHIEDDELTFLYNNIQYVALPYSKTSQSGVLEMDFYFKKSIIASNIPYFKETLLKFPSFGLLANGSFTQILKEAIEKHFVSTYFTNKDYNNYMHREEISRFTTDFKNYILA